MRVSRAMREIPLIHGGSQKPVKGTSVVSGGGGGFVRGHATC